MTRPKMRDIELNLAVLVPILLCAGSAESKCGDGCDALGSYTVWNGTNMTFISDVFATTTDNILSFNPGVDKDRISIGERIIVPYECNCIHGQFLGRNFSYKIITGDSYVKIAEKYYANLTTVDWLRSNNNFKDFNIPDVDTSINVIVNCSCGNKKVSKDYGLFLTYPIGSGENLNTIANMSGIPPELLQNYNRDSNFSSGLVYIPWKGKYYSLKFEVSFDCQAFMREEKEC